MRKPKVVVVGAGPAGSSCALVLRQKNTAEVVLLDKSSYPRIKVCGSGLSPLALSVLGKLGLKERFRARHGSLAGLFAKGPEGHLVRMAAGEGAWVVPRTEFDHALATTAEALGAQFRQETKVTELLRDSSGAVRAVKTTQGTIEADAVICADGAPSRFSIDARPKKTIRTLMGWWKGTTAPSDACVMVWDRRLAGYYLWSFPEPDGVTNIGLTIPEDAPDAERLKELFQELLDEHFSKELQGAELVRKWMGHPAVVTTSIGKVAESQVLWAGEAARLVMPGTAEGIGFALESGVHAATFLSQHFLAEGRFSRVAQERFRLETALRTVPKFAVGEAFVRGMRSRSVRNAGAYLFSSRVQSALAEGVVTLLGEQRTAH